MKKNKSLIVVLIAIIAAAAVFALMKDNTSPDSSSASSAPDFSLEDQYGKTHTLSEYKGKAVILNFWATWCPNCVNEFPAFQKEYDENGKNRKDVIILGIYAPDYGREAAKADVISYFKDLGLTYPILADEDASVFEQYAISALPTTVMIDKSGKAAGINTGQMSTAELKDTIKRLSER